MGAIARTALDCPQSPFHTAEQSSLISQREAIVFRAISEDHA